MKKQWYRLAAVLVCLALLTGCDGVFFNAKTALRAPGAAGLYQGVQEALEKAVGENIILKYPSVKGTHTAFYPRDIDGDGAKEILAFYQMQTEGAVTRVHLIRYEDDAWQSVQDLEPVGGDITDVDFCDLDGDGKEEVCIGWSVYTASGNQMCIYQLENGKLVQRAAETYTRHVVCDIDNDGIQELGLAVLDSVRHTSTISFYEMLQNGTLSVLGSLVLDGSVLSYADITAASITTQTAGVYLDAYKGTDAMITELIYFRGGRLYNPFASSKNAVNIASLRYCSLTSSDVNADGVMEIPFSELLPGYSEGDETPTHHLIRWRYFNGRISDTVYTWWYNAGEHYYLNIDSTWQDHITVVHDAKAKSYGFYEWTGSAIGDCLFQMKVFTSEAFEKQEDNRFQQLYANTEYVWAASVEEDNAYAITLQKLKDSFYLILQ